MRSFPHLRRSLITLAAAATLACIADDALAARISRLTPPSELFSSGSADPIIARFLPGQRFDLQATVQPDAGQSINLFAFYVDGSPVTNVGSAEAMARTSIDTETGAAATCIDATTGTTTGASGCKLAAHLPSNTAIVSQ